MRWSAAVSRAGRRARRERLVVAGHWRPETEEDRAAAMFAEQDLWTRVGGTLAWERELARRRGARNARHRAARRARALEAKHREHIAA
jgi:hypothetical protein